ncbi:molybdenum hydroxylase [Clostridium carboxidivorans P7]|uniref:Selenium-dependent molybdenum hydroxylase system protein, YqeB family n=1 Tax=Clostridium carboxidivorans P7 TaxID=536227 RepID=C6PWF5_9CLOT|nr:selenium-dependent molybdenum cofactor biosynthesis protein YqeB [Clostridium carboxidivorans]AKN30517.1 molybdenum hydroxylase [Clostridium carboxidivorans P7]EET86432.1 selenium-dependent molybdenum hydroxylase system protein, YqeB family [Clostridium carboxidivorans P7]EFG86259.1 selenium-dependent molybdenum hydroxylase system protein, YqeB family [Clostridium carboxidivorans P7]
MIEDIVIIRGGGDIASGIVQKLYRSGFKVLIAEVEKPTSIRRKVCFSEAIFDGYVIVEGIKAVLVKNIYEIKKAWSEGIVPVIVDPEGKYIDIIKPQIVIDAIIAKKNLGTNLNMAPMTIAVGPGFEAGKDVDVVVETMRGHNLGRLIFSGMAMKNTGVPGKIAGYSKERVIHSPASGIIDNIKEIADIVKAGEVIAYVDGIEVKATIDGVLRGLIRNESKISKGLKIADIDPRIEEKQNCYTISDKARSIGGAVLEAVLYLKATKTKTFREMTKVV